MAVCIGCGLEIDPITGLLEVQLRPGGGLDCDNTGDANDGLFVVFPPPTGIIADDTTCSGLNGGVTISGDGTAGSHLSAVVPISTDNCNGIRCTASGLYAPCPDTVTSATLRGYTGAIFPVALNIGGGPAATFGVVNDGAVITATNNLCCNIEGFWDVQAFGGRVEANPGFNGYAYLLVSIDGGGFNEAVPVTRISMDNRASAPGDPNGGVVEYYLSNFEDKNLIDAASFIPTQAHTFAAAIEIHVLAGTGTWFDGRAIAGDEPPRFEFHWQFVQNCC